MENSKKVEILLLLYFQKPKDRSSEKPLKSQQSGNPENSKKGKSFYFCTFKKPNLENLKNHKNHNKGEIPLLFDISGGGFKA